eukprot:jgi/Botrbrau1/15552/Bobra.0273s0004.1
MDHIRYKANKEGCNWLESWNRSAAANGQWECLKLLRRIGGFNYWCSATADAAASGQLQCLKNIIQLDEGVLHSDVLRNAALGGSLACLTFLVEAGCQWNGNVAVAAAGSGSVEALRFCLQGCHNLFQDWDWKMAMAEAIQCEDLDCMKALYDYGYQRPPADYCFHPARLAIYNNSLACLRLAVQFSGPPQIQQDDLRDAAAAGEEMLKYVHGEFGGKLDSGATESAASAGQVGALRYALRHGAPLSAGTLEAALENWSGECLKCAFEHGLAVGFSAALTPPTRPWLPWERFTECLQVLRYVCEVMRPARVQQFLTHVAGSLARKTANGWKGGKDGLRVFQYLAKQMEGPLPQALEELVRVRRERAGALAGVFYKAKLLAKAGAPSPSVALWDAMDRVPSELRERIAFEALLVCPKALLGPL